MREGKWFVKKTGAYWILTFLRGLVFSDFAIRAKQVHVCYSHCGCQLEFLHKAFLLGNIHVFLAQGDLEIHIHIIGIRPNSLQNDCG
jgi:hypothetical protein